MQGDALGNRGFNIPFRMKQEMGKRRVGKEGPGSPHEAFGTLLHTPAYHVT
jgi:hypothetical protein